MRLSSPPLLLAVLLCAGCTVAGSSPSLAPRAIERELGGLPPPTGPCRLDGDGCANPDPLPLSPPLPPVDDARFAARVDALLTTARAGASRFADQREAASAAARRAGDEGSDSWIAAQQALSRLEAARAQTADALADLDALALARSREPTSAADGARLSAAVEEAQRLADAQAAEIERLRGGLSRR